MSELAYLGLVVFLSVGGSLIFLRQQRRTVTLESGVQNYSRAMEALANAHATTRQRSGSGSADRK